MSEMVAAFDCQTGLFAERTATQAEVTMYQAAAIPVPPPPPPTLVAAGSGTGTGAAAVLHQGDPGFSTDVRGIVDVTAGTSPAADANGHYPLAVISFGTAYPIAPLGAQIDRVGANAVALGLVFSDLLSVNGFSIIAQSAPVAGQTYRITYALG